MFRLVDRNSREILLALSVLAIVGVLLYYRALGAPWYLDDFGAIVQNKAIRSLFPADAPLFFGRPLSYLSFALNYRLTGLDPFAFRVGNVLIHVASSFLVFLLLRIFFSGRFFIAICGALVFLSHPVQTQAVTYIVQRMATLSGFFCFLSVFCYCRYRLGPEAHPQGGGRCRAWYTASLLAFGCAAFSKENAITLPAMLLVLDCVWFKANPRHKRRYLLTLFPFLAICLAVVLQKLFIDFFGTYETAKLYYYVQRDGGGLDLLLAAPDQVRAQYLYTQFIIVWKYVLIFLLPVNQMLDYGYPLAESLLNVKSLAGFAGVVLALAAAWWCRKTRPLVTIGILWYFVMISVESSFFPLDPVFEHRLYVPSFGLLLLLLDLCRDWQELVSGRLAALLVIVLLSMLTLRRNSLWADPVAFWADNAARSPHNFRPKSHLATELTDAGRYVEALALQQEVVQALPSADHYTNLGRIYMKVGDYRGAADVFEQLVRSAPADAENYLNYSIALGEAGDYSAAQSQAKKAYALKPDDVRVLTNLGIAHARIGDRGNAEVFLRRVLQVDPGNVVAMRNLELLQREGAGR